MLLPRRDYRNFIIPFDEVIEDYKELLEEEPRLLVDIEGEFSVKSIIKDIVELHDFTANDLIAYHVDKRLVELDNEETPQELINDELLKITYIVSSMIEDLKADTEVNIRNKLGLKIEDTLPCYVTWKGDNLIIKQVEYTE